MNRGSLRSVVPLRGIRRTSYRGSFGTPSTKVKVAPKVLRKPSPLTKAQKERRKNLLTQAAPQLMRTRKLLKARGLKATPHIDRKLKGVVSQRMEKARTLREARTNPFRLHSLAEYHRTHSAIKKKVQARKAARLADEGRKTRALAKLKSRSQRAFSKPSIKKSHELRQKARRIALEAKQQWASRR